jgi:hypothetical protein
MREVAGSRSGLTDPEGDRALRPIRHALRGVNETMRVHDHGEQQAGGERSEHAP